MAHSHNPSGSDPRTSSTSVAGVVLVHGAMLTSRCWDAVIAHLTMPTIAVDLPGRAGRPAELATVTLDDCVRAVVDAADQAGWERFALVGHSLGAVTITETAWQYPGRIDQLVYVGALIPGPGQSGATVRFGGDWPPGQPVTIEEEMARTHLGNDLTDEQWTAIWPGIVPEAGGVLNARLSGYPDHAPSTYVSMTDDATIPPTLAEDMIANLAVSVEHRVLTAGHLVMVSKPTELAAIINDAWFKADHERLAVLGLN